MLICGNGVLYKHSCCVQCLNPLPNQIKYQHKQSGCKWLYQDCRITVSSFSFCKNLCDKVFIPSANHFPCKLLGNGNVLAPCCASNCVHVQAFIVEEDMIGPCI